VSLTLQFPFMEYRKLAHGLPQPLHYNTITAFCNSGRHLDWAALLWHTSYVGYN